MINEFLIFFGSLIFTLIRPSLQTSRLRTYIIVVYTSSLGHRPSFSQSVFPDMSSDPEGSLLTVRKSVRAESLELDKRFDRTPRNGIFFDPVINTKI